MKAVLTWNPNTEPDLASYKVYVSVNGGAEAFLAAVPKGTTTYTHDPLPGGSGSVAYTLTAMDLSGNESLHSVVVTKVYDAVPPQAPTGLVVVVS